MYFAYFAYFAMLIFVTYRRTLLRNKLSFSRSVCETFAVSIMYDFSVLITLGEMEDEIDILYKASAPIRWIDSDPSLPLGTFK